MDVLVQFELPEFVISERSRADVADGTGQCNIEICSANRGGKSLKVKNSTHVVSFLSSKILNTALFYAT
jgi:hypothetical protein